MNGQRDDQRGTVDRDGDLIAAYVFAGEHPIAKISAGGVIEYYLPNDPHDVLP